MAEQQQQSGEEDQPSHDTSFDDDVAATSEEAANHEDDDDDAVPPAVDDGDETAELELESAQLPAEEHRGNDVLPEQQQSVLAAGEKEAENSVSETEAEAASEHSSEVGPNAAAEPEAGLDEVKPRHATVGGDLEAMVTMLQGPSFPSATHLDVAGEIPDEE